MRLFLGVIFMLIPAISSAVDVDFSLKNFSHIYNGENGSYWKETRTTLTYLDNTVEPTFIFTFSPTVSLEAGAGFYFTFDQETKLRTWFPVFRSVFRFNWGEFVVGSLKNDHDLPECILDPLIRFNPVMRLPMESTSQYPLNTYEGYAISAASHGRYEYGTQLRWDSVIGKGEIYINWQLADLSNGQETHRERFDVGLIHHYDLGPLPLYAAVHYWHNGGHENPHPYSITEDYSYSAGFRNSNWSVLALASTLIPDRESHPEYTTNGFGLYAEANLPFFDWEIGLRGFVSAEFLDPKLKFITVEGDPFYRVPAYVGLNFSRGFELTPDTSLKIGFVNGIYHPKMGTEFTWLNIRYDQSVQFNIEYKIPLTRPEEKK